MNIIILDLEWNSCYCKKIGKFINEILEFGAVKLDGQLNVADTFQCLIRSSLTKKLRNSVKELTNISNDDMQHGIGLKQAVENFTQWAGPDSLILTWSNSDIYVLIENCSVLLNLKNVPFLYKYADVQKYIMAQMGISGNQISLSNAAEQNGLDMTEFSVHRALGDSLCCAQLLKKIGLNEQINKYIVDATKPDYYQRFLFKPYPISDINSPFIDKKELYAVCPECKQAGDRKSKWRYKNRNFSATFNCKNCKKKFIGRVRFKKTFDGVDVTHFSTVFLDKSKVKKENSKNEK